MSLKFNPTTGQLDVVLDKASEIKYDGTSSGLAAADVQSAVDEVQANINALPDPIVYKGTWDASTNTPTLANTDTGKEGFLYQVNVAGTVNFGAGNISFDIGDKVVNNGSVWSKWDMTDSVTSVNGQNGTVVLTSSDISEGTNLYFTDERAQDATGAMATSSSKVSLTYNDGLNTLTPDIVAGSLVNADINASAAIAATKIGNGDVDNTELSYLNGVTSGIQSQIDGKQATGNYVTALTGDVTASGPGSATATLATVNSNIGSFGNATNVSTVTVNAKGLVTAASNTPIQIAESQVTNLVTDLAGKANVDLSNILPTASVDFNSQKLVDVANPTDLQDVSTKQWSTTQNSGVRNYLQYNDFENNATTGWSLFGTTLTGVIPTGTINAADGTLSTFNISSTNPIAGSRSLRSDSGGPITAGQGFISDAFTIDNADKAKVLTYKFYYDAVSNSGQNFSGTSANTFAIYIYDVTNSAWIQPAGVYGMTQGSGVGYTTGTFQTTSNSTQYRLAIIYINGTSAGSTYTFDRFYLGPQTAPIGAVVTDWVAYTPTISNFGTTTSVTFEYARQGDSILVRGRFTSGIPAASVASWTLPNGLTPDIAKLQSVVKVVGTAQRAGTDGIYSILATGNQNAINFGAGAGRLTPQNANNIIQNGESVAFETDPIPVTGWSSNVQMSNDTDTRVVAVQAFRSSTNQSLSATTSDQKVQWNGLTKDTHGTFDSATNYRYVVPVAGTYSLNGVLIISSASGASNFDVKLFKNGAPVRAGNFTVAIVAATFSMPFNFQIDAVAGDYFEIYANTANQSASIASSSVVYGGSQLNIQRLSGPSVIAATDTVAARYSTSAGQTITNITPTTITFGTKDYDTTGIWNGTTATIPVSGKYAIDALVALAYSNASALTTYISIYKNGVDVKHGTRFEYAASVLRAGGVLGLMVHDDLNCLAGDTIQIKVYSDNGADRTLGTNILENVMSIKRVGN